MADLSNFIGLYPVSKTLRFELIPQGKTLEHIKNKGFLDRDEHRADSYLLVKKIIDDYHKSFISRALEGLRLQGIDEYVKYREIPNRSEEEKKKFTEVQGKLRKQIADQFSKHEDYKTLFAKELIREVLKGFVKTEEELKLVDEFKNFTTYFTGFHENRKNIYSDEEKATAIAYRLIHENLPRFLDNIHSFKKILKSPVSERFGDLLSDSQLGPTVQVASVEDMFQPEFFNETLTQLGIDQYNHLVGGFVPIEGEEKIKGLNEYINLHNQTAKKEERLAKLKPLYKQILSDRMTASYIPEQFTSDEELLESIEKFYQEINDHVLNKNVRGQHSLKSLLQNLSNFDPSGIFLQNNLGLTEISQKAFGDWSAIQKGVDNWFDLNYHGKARKGTDNYLKEQRRFSKNQDSYSIQFLDECLVLINSSESIGIAKYFGLLGKNADTTTFFERIETNYKSIIDLLNNPYPHDKNLAQDKISVEKIKLFLDTIKELQWFIKPLLGNGDETGKDEQFYGEFSALWNTLDLLTPLYGKVRNYLTRKPYSTEKMKLNFENSTLLDGWDVNKECDNTSLIFRRGELYYLGIMDKKHNRIFKDKIDNEGDSYYEKMEYKLLPGANKMLPKVFFSKSRIDEFAPSAKLMENYQNETHKKGSSFNLKDCHDLIDFFKGAIQKHEDWKNFGFKFSNTSSYEDLSGFYREVEQQGYKISFRKVPETFINEMVDEGKLYLFQIYNKDFSSSSKGRPNLHTLYWKMLFDAENLRDVVYKLNGQAEVFYRKASIKKENLVVHEANKNISNKNAVNIGKQSCFAYDIIKDRRYTIEKFQFHVPISMNFKSRAISNINNIVNNFLKENTDVHVIGIDRGERHLLYLTLIDQNGSIIQQYSLNEIVNEYKGETYRTDYHYLLDQREGSRDEARRSWKTIETIKELKEGYLSQVINKIAQLIVQYNAIVVLEDLNTGFMRGRQKVEKQVYQKFEKMLIDKLNFLVDKKKSASEPGGTLKAYQLSNQFDGFNKMGKQSGFLFYVPAWNTSKMDPVTGFVNLFDTRYENMDKAKSFFEKFKAIRYNPEKNYFEFDFDYNDFTTKAEGTKTNWTLCTNKNRIETFRNPDKNNQWDDREINLTKEMSDLLEYHGITYQEGKNIQSNILGLNDKAFFERLLHLVKLTLQMRNSKTGTEIDFLISPVANSHSEFFDSRYAPFTLPQNADANGAYNIARKGLWAINNIRSAEDAKRLKLAISNKEWLYFAQTYMD